MHGRIVNVPNSFNLVQNVLPQMSYDDFSIYMKIIRIQIYIYVRLHSSKTWYESVIYIHYIHMQKFELNQGYHSVQAFVTTQHVNLDVDATQCHVRRGSI
jgi:hypothetical protein